MRNLLILLVLIITLSSCKQNLLPYPDARKLLLKTLYPQKITADFNFITRYETKVPPEKWKNEPWKVKNNLLEKAGLIKQQIADTSIEFYIQLQARYENRHQYIYKVIQSDLLKSLLIEPVNHRKRFDEWDYWNKNTGRRDWITCKAICGEIKLDSILNIDCSQGESDVKIDYKERYYPTPFNEMVDYGIKYHANYMFYRRINAHKYSGEDWQLSSL